jgi:RNA polymerase sigma factor (sigma-70 family)
VNSLFPARLVPLPPWEAVEENQDAASPDSTSDEALMLCLQVGKQEALSSLFNRYSRLVRSISARILRDSAEAEDLVQDLFLFIQRKCGVFDSSKSSARSWIIQMAYHRAFERRRYLATRQLYSQAGLQNGIPEVVGAPTTEDDYSPRPAGNSATALLRGIYAARDQRETRPAPRKRETPLLPGHRQIAQTHL